jgi:hypothetical protein
VARTIVTKRRLEPLIIGLFGLAPRRIRLPVMYCLPVRPVVNHQGLDGKSLRLLGAPQLSNSWELMLCTSMRVYVCHEHQPTGPRNERTSHDAELSIAGWT